jgi:hypothetical protein
MIKVYIDWNIMSGMKNGNFTELLSIIENKEKFLLPYSTSHIGDILASNSEDIKQQEIIQTDFDFITRLTNNLCLFNTGKNVLLDYYEPREIFDDQIDSKGLTTDLSIDNLFSSIELDETLKPLIESYKALLNSINLDAVLKQAYDTPEGAEMMNKMFPGLENDFTMNGFFKSFGLLLENLNEKEGLKDLREIIQQVGINSSHFNPEKEPFQLIENAYSKMGFDENHANKYFERGKNAPIWFDEITNEYIKLDLHGFNSDKVKVTEKEKNTFRNTTEDASHSAFASICDFYITQDKKNYNKSKAVYKKLNINTKVFKPEEFIEYYNKFLKADSINDHFTDISDSLHSSDKFFISEYEDGSGKILTQLTDYYFFNFFNKIMVPQTNSADDAVYILSKENPAQNYMITFQEFEAVIKLFTENLGSDNDGKMYLQTDEFDNNNWDGRSWTFGNNTLRILRLNGWFQLYLFRDSEKRQHNLFQRIKLNLKKFFNLF